MKLLNNASGPLYVQLLLLERRVYIGQLEYHLRDDESVLFARPVDGRVRVRKVVDHVALATVA